MIFHLDYNAFGRSADMESALREAKASKVMIDHHQQPEDWPDFIYSDTDMSSTCQMIYEFCDMFGWLEHLDKHSAESIYTGSSRIREVLNTALPVAVPTKWQVN